MWTVDKSHSEVGFSVRHLGVARVRGHFNDYAVRIEVDPAKPENSTVEVTIQAASIDTQNDGRDARPEAGHLPVRQRHRLDAGAAG